MQVNLDQVMLQNIIAEAVFVSISEDQRKTLITAAIASLLKQDENGSSYYGSKTSPLERAFREAVQRVAEKCAQQMMTENAEVQAKIQGLLNEALVVVMDTNREQNVKRIAEAIAKGLSYDKDRY